MEHEKSTGLLGSLSEVAGNPPAQKLLISKLGNPTAQLAGSVGFAFDRKESQVP